LPNIFPPRGYSLLVWIAVVPFFYALKKADLKQRCILGMISGIASYSLIVNWVFPFSFSGGAVFVLYLSLQPVLFSALFPHDGKHAAVNGIYAAALWAASEYTRGILIGGFSWGISHALSFEPYFIQAASTTGAYGISFFIILANYFLFVFFEKRTDIRYLLYFIAVPLGLYCSGFLYINKNSPLNETGIKIAVIQGNIDPVKKWDDDFAEEIFNTYEKLTGDARSDKPDIVIWPETSLPRDYINDSGARSRIESLSRGLGSYLLVGAPLMDKDGNFNSALLFFRGIAVKRYDKMLLVPFSENIFEKGRMPGMFEIENEHMNGGEPFRFGVTICSEDLYQFLPVYLVDSGADFMINITNDAVLGRSRAAYVHLGASVMRAVETGRSTVKCANSGISCFIDEYGRITGNVSRNGEEVFVAGFFTDNVSLGRGKTFFLKSRGFFLTVCFIISAYFIALKRKEFFK